MAKCLLVENHLLIGVIWGISCEYPSPLPRQPDYGKASGVHILASISADSDAAASCTIQKHFSFVHLLSGGQ